MMRTLRTLSVLRYLLGGIGLLASACASTSATPAGTNDGGDADTSPVADASATDGGGADDASPPAPKTYLRVAQLSPDLPPIDVCVAPHGTTAFQGPLVGQLAASLGDDGGASSLPGLGYLQVSAYVLVDPGIYDVRLVAAGAPSCSPSLSLPASPSGDAGAGLDAGSVDSGTADAATDSGDDADPAADATPSGSTGTPDWTDLPAIAVNTSTTLLVAGDWQPAGADHGLGLSLLADDVTLAGGASALRAVNAVPSWPAVDFGLGSFPTAWAPLLVDVPFGAAGARAGAGDGVVDANGYLPIAPLAAQAIGARPSSSDAGTAVAVANSVEVDLGSTATVIAVGGKTGDPAHPPALLLCIDDLPSGGLLSDCSVAQ